MNLDILTTLATHYPNESASTLIEFYKENNIDLTVGNCVKIFEHTLENKDYNRKKILNYCKKLNEEEVYFKFVGEHRIVFTKYFEFYISDDNLDSIEYWKEEISIEKTKIIFKSKHRNGYCEKFNISEFTSDKYIRITKNEYERVIDQNLKRLEHNFDTYKK